VHQKRRCAKTQRLCYFMKKIYYCGNQLLESDNLPFRLIPKLKKYFPAIDFVHHDPSENLPMELPENKLGFFDIIIIDTVINTEKVVKISDEKQLSTQAVYSPHDWDLALNLKLLLKLNKLKTFLIIGLPPQGDEEKILGDVAMIIKKDL
jgi:Ni,Fe-hydrogenase maturation factor